MGRKSEGKSRWIGGPGRSVLVALLVLIPAVAAACGDAGGEGGRTASRDTPSLGALASTPRATVPATAVPAPRPEPEDAVRSEPAVTREVTYEEAESAFRERDYGLAVELFEAYTDRRPDNPWGHYMLGLSAWKSGASDRSITAFERALELDPEHGKTLVNLSRVLLEQGRPDDALARIQIAVEMDAEAPGVLRVLGNAKADLGDAEGAIEAYRRAITLDVSDGWSMNNLGLVLIRQGRSEEALGPLARAAELDGGIAVFLNNLGVALERTGHAAEAVVAYRAALDADASYEKAEISLARVEQIHDGSDSALDLAVLARGFEEEIESWREPVSTVALPDPTGSGPVAPGPRW